MSITFNIVTLKKHSKTASHKSIIFSMKQIIFRVRARAKLKDQFRKVLSSFKNKIQELDMNCSESVQEQLKNILWTKNWTISKNNCS